MTASAVAASVVSHFENAEHTPADNFLSAVVIRSGSKHHCSGVILDGHWIITTAHCVAKYTKEELHVSYQSNGHQISSNVDAVVLHPGYKQGRLVNNVALIKVKSEIDFNAVVQAAKLPTVDTEEDELAYAIGWEKVDGHSQPSGALKYYQTKVMALDLCWERLEDLDAVEVDDNVICTYGPTENTSPLLDNGSALVSVNKSELVGVSFWNEEGYSNVYSRVRSHLTWINSVRYQNA
ncbi:mite allergen Der p 3-like isoform X2 [Sitodiplosis mosellana]|nr:mite allergen Der p 3-like isoform X2 [Sitodiplosis mosellana]XP_055298844.1 mite allergen Der p 3-like isoform X2 [Sitodiplosis mosellana]